VPLSDDDVREILRIVDQTPLQELTLETDGFSLHLKKRGGVAEPVSSTVDAPAEPGLHTIEAPMLGTFYRAEGPGQEPFVDLGSKVEPDTIVCIIEVMKMMNSVPAGVSGTVVEVCHENAELAEYGEPLFRVKPE
jgi:acetyl-CoA carboxylase biotin carboxyl carrier protein